jgi:hypothetical protein
MAKYRLNQAAHDGATKIAVAGKEYAVKDGVFEVADDNLAAHAAAKQVGATLHYDKPDAK